MDTVDEMEIEKKAYTTPELVEHGNLIEMTQAGGNGAEDGEFGSLGQMPPPF